MDWHDPDQRLVGQTAQARGPLGRMTRPDVGGAGSVEEAREEGTLTWLGARLGPGQHPESNGAIGVDVGVGGGGASRGERRVANGGLGDGNGSPG